MGIAALVPRETKLLTEPLTTIEQSGIFEGYASLFGIADLGKDVVVPGAFADTSCQARRRRYPAAVAARSRRADRALAIHRGGSRGLRVRGKLNLAVERARDIHALMRTAASTACPSAFGSSGHGRNGRPG